MMFDIAAADDFSMLIADIFRCFRYYFGTDIFEISIASRLILMLLLP